MLKRKTMFMSVVGVLTFEEVRVEDGREFTLIFIDGFPLDSLIAKEMHKETNSYEITLNMPATEGDRRYGRTQYEDLGNGDDD